MHLVHLYFFIRGLYYFSFDVELMNLRFVLTCLCRSFTMRNASCSVAATRRQVQKSTKKDQGKKMLLRSCHHTPALFADSIIFLLMELMNLRFFARPTR